MSLTRVLEIKNYTYQCEMSGKKKELKSFKNRKCN